MMLSDKDVIVNLALDYCDEEGSWLLCSSDSCNVGEDVE